MQAASHLNSRVQLLINYDCFIFLLLNQVLIDVCCVFYFCREEWATHGLKEVPNSTAPMTPPNIGGLFSTGPDVQSVWTYNNQ